MSITYDELVFRGPVWSYAQNTTLVQEMERIVETAQEQVIQRVDHDLFRDQLVKVVASPGTLVDLTTFTPEVFEVRALLVPYPDPSTLSSDGYFQPLRRRDINYLWMMYGNVRRPARRPLYYGETEERLKYQVFPRPAGSVVYRCAVNRRPPLLSPTQQLNVMSTECPRVLERAVLRECAIFMKDAEGVQRYTTELNDAVKEINSQIERRRRDETGTRPIEAANTAGR